MNKLSEEEKLTISTYEEFPDNWAAYFDQGGGWPTELKEFKKILPKGRVLEIGMGSGRDAQHLIRAGYDYVGTDISEALLKIAHRNCPGQKLLKMSLYDLSFDEKFDGFWASAVLLHVPKKRIDEALQKIKNTQKNGAVGFISIKDGRGEVIIRKRIEGQETQRFFALWKRSEFENVLKRNGFKVLYYSHRVVTENTKWHMFIVRLAG